MRWNEIARWRDLLEPMAVFALAMGAVVAVVHLRAVSPFLRDNLPIVIATVFLLMTAGAIRLSGEDARQYGLRLESWKGELVLVFVLCAVIFPLYAVGFKLYWGLGADFQLRLPSSFWAFFLDHLIVVALPEEFLFRGFIQQRLGAFLPWRLRIAGLTFGWHIPAASALFAAGHFLVDLNPNRLATFFPALLFGMLKERRGSLIGCTLFHALCNVFSDILVWGYYGKWMVPG